MTNQICCDFPEMETQYKGDHHASPARYGCSNCGNYTDYMAFPSLTDGKPLKGGEDILNIGLKKAWQLKGYLPLDWVSREDDYPKTIGEQYDVIIDGKATKAVYWDLASFHDENCRDVFPSHWAYPFLIAMSE